MARRTLEDRFWSHVDKRDDGCWVWTGATRSGGYGVFHDGERSRAAYRFSWELAYGPLAEGLAVSHVCGTRRCVRPEHLQLVNASDRSRGDRHVVLSPYPMDVNPEPEQELEAAAE
jgi:hypothetical protein